MYVEGGNDIGADADARSLYLVMMMMIMMEEGNVEVLLQW